MEKEKLHDLKDDVPILQGIIMHTEKSIELKIFNVEIIRKRTTGNFCSKETFFGWHKGDEDRKTFAKLSVIILLSPTESSM